MALRIIPDEGKPSVALEISLERPLLDYDLEQIDQPTPRDVDGVLVSQGFRDLIDDARGVLTDLIAHEPHKAHGARDCELDLSHSNEHAFQLEQLTGAICPGDDEVYRPGLWIILRDAQANPKASLPQAAKERIASIGRELMKRLQLED